MTREIKQIITQALKEDAISYDLTTLAAFSSYAPGKAVIISKEKGGLCGINLVKDIFSLDNKKLKFTFLKQEGQLVKKGDKIAYIEGDVRVILSRERTALNFLSLLSGIATSTAEFVSKVEGTEVKILDTRKTTPCLRSLEKYAVTVGGGCNHRKNLSDGIIVKDNHLRAGKFLYKNKLDEDKFKQLLLRLRKKSSLKIEVEVENIPEFKAVIKYHPDIVMLDNFTLPKLRDAVCLRDKFFPKILIEASGGVDLRNVRKIALAGVDFISIGSITHSAKAIDFSLEIL